MRYLTLTCVALLCVSAVASADVVLDETWTTSRVYGGWNTLTEETAAPYSGASNFQIQTLTHPVDGEGLMAFMLTLDAPVTVNDLGGDPAKVGLKFMYKMTGEDCTINMMMCTDNDYGYAPLNDPITLTAASDWTEATVYYTGWTPTLTYSGCVPGGAGDTPTGDTSMGRLMFWRHQGGGFGSNVTLQMDDVRFEQVPEPATMSLLGFGALALLRRRKA